MHDTVNRPQLPQIIVRRFSDNQYFKPLATNVFYVLTNTFSDAAKHLDQELVSNAA